MESFDVAILGASISGASLGACLGREGVKVALIDKDRFPRRKPCGEGLSNIGIDALRRMGLDVDRALVGGVPYYEYRIDVGKRSVPLSRKRNPSLKGIGVERLNLDRQLVEEAVAQPSLKPFFESKADALSPQDGGHVIRLSSGVEIGARFLVLADGGHSPGANQLGIPKQRRNPPLWGISFILEGHYTKSPEEVVVLLKDGFEINCTPVSESRLNVTFLTGAREVKSLQGEGLREQLLAEACRKTGFCGTPMGAPLQIGPVNSTRRPGVWGSTILVGDALETLDPVAGMGMTHGVLTAEIAFDTLRAILQEDADPDFEFREYTRRVEAVTRPFRGFTRLTASLLRSRVRRILVPALASTCLPGMIRCALDDSVDSTSRAFSLLGQFLSCVGA